MARNNKNTYIYKTQQDSYRRARERRKSIDKFDEDKKNVTKEDIANLFEEAFTGKEVILNSNVGTINNPEKNLNPITAKKNYDYSRTTEAIKKLHDNNFYEVVSGKIQTSEELMIKTIENNKKLQMINQAGKANESLLSFKEKMEYMKKVKDNNGSFIVYDLETLGGKDANGVWRPTHITEFSMHRYDKEGKDLNKTDILLGWQDETEANKLIKRIENAITDGSIDYDEELRVTAGRLSLYGDERVTKVYDKDLKVFKTGSFIDTKDGDMKDIERIKRGAQFFLDIGKEVEKDKYGVPLDVKLMMQTIADNNRILNNEHAMLIDYNGSMFDKPIIDSFANTLAEKYPSLRKMFDNNKVTLSANGNKHLDMQGALQQFRNNFSTKELLGDKVNQITEERLNRQEHYVQLLYQELFNDKQLKPHEASSDVTALSFFFTQKSDALINANGESTTLLDYISDKLSPIIQSKIDNNQVFDLDSTHVLKAKGKQGTFGGKNLLNFAIDKRTNDVFTADNHMIRNKEILKQSFNVGVGINKDAYYQLGGVRRIESGDPYLQTMREAFPQYASSDLYAVTLDMMTTEKYKDSRLDSLSQVVILNGETELNAFMANTFDVVAKQEGDDFKIYNKDAFDIREYDIINNKPVLKDVNANHSKSNKQLVQDNIEFQNRKLTTSRAEGSINAENAYNNIKRALNIQTEAKQILGESISDRQLNKIMYDVEIPTIDSELAKKMKAAVTGILEHKNGVYDSTIDNMSTYMNTIKDNSAYYTKLLSTLESHNKFGKNKSKTIQKEMFKRVDRHLRETLASNIYEDLSRQKKSILGDESLQAPIEYFKNLYEMDLAAMPGIKKEKYFDLAKAKEKSLLRLDLNKNNVEYDLVKEVNNLFVGNRKIRTEDSTALKNENFRKYLGFMLKDKDFKDTINSDFRNELFEIVNENKTYNHIDVAGRFINELKAIKEKDKFAGILSTNLYMKDLTSTSGYSKALNGEKFINSMEGIINSFVDDMDLRLINGSKHAAEEFVKDNLLKHYVPTNATELVHKKVSLEMQDYLTDIVYSADKIGANIAVNKHGDITLQSDGHNVTLSLPKIKSDGDSNVWYINSGNMNNTLMAKLNINPTRGGTSVNMDVSTNFGDAIGGFSFSKSVANHYEKQGSGSATKEAINYIDSLTRTSKKKIIKNSTVNGFNGNDVNSNRLIDASSIANVMEELFDKNGKLNHLVRNHEFLDKSLQEVLGKDVARYIQSGKPIEELDANMTKDLIKNMPHLLEILGVKANVQGTEVDEVLKQISFTANVKKSSSMVGVIGDMSLFSPHAALSNLQRPPVLAAGNAIPLRAEAIKGLEGSGVFAGNLISTASIDKNTMRYVNGVGQTTTDVMMNVAYVSTDALDIIKHNNIDRVLATKSNVDVNYKEQMTRMFSKLNTYEQERFMDGRLAEKMYGIMPSKVQNISASKDIASAVEHMSKKDAISQAELLMGLKGSITIDEAGNLSYKSATGKYVKRGDSIVQTLGFGEQLEAISPKVQQGVFTHKYVKSNGMALTDKEITNIINKNKSVFLEDNKLLSSTNANIKLTRLLEDNYEANGLFRIQDISAAAFIKPTTSSTEKGMTNLNYVKTGSLDKNVDNFFKSIGFHGVAKQSYLYDESIDAILNEVDGKKLSEALKSNGFKSAGALKEAVNKERNAFNEFLIDGVFNKKAHMFVNDGVQKHGGAGQTQFGVLNKAISNLIAANKNDVEGTLKKVADIINSDEDYQFLSTRNLNTNKVNPTNFKFENGKIYMDDMSTSISKLTTSDISKLESLINVIDKEIEEAGGNRVVQTKGYVQKWDKEKKQMEIVPINEDKPLLGEWITEEIDGKKVFIAPITSEDVKLLPDVETQTGTESKYFELKDKLMALKSQKNSSTNQADRQRLIEEINIIESELRNYESVSKRMSISTTEYQLLERVRVTEQHAQHMQLLMNKGELSDDLVEELLASQALKGKIIRGEDGSIKIAEKELQTSPLDHWLKRFKGQLTFNPQEELKLTAEDVKEGAALEHLSTIFERADKYGYDVGQDSAEKLYKLEMADNAVRFNSKGNITIDRMKDLGFEVRKIDEINFEIDEIAKKNLLVDLGEEFKGRNRYIAVAGTGHLMNEDEEILTNGQKQLMSLARRYDEYKDVKHNPELRVKESTKVKEQAEKAIQAIEQSIYGKNAYADTLNKAQVDDVNYRYKASGAVTSEFTPGLNKALAQHGDGKLEINNELLDKRFINNKSLTEWHKEGVHYDYKFVSLEAMKDMGMFKPETMEAYGAKDKADMIEKLKKHGTMDITDRYPNNRNDSVLMTHTFLDTDLVGNQTKVSGTSGLKMNLDHDGDSVSSFALRYKTKDGDMLDYGMFLNNPDMVKQKSEEAYTAFSEMLTTTTMRATTENRKWAEDVNDILIKDAIKNSELTDMTKTVVVPGGKSILGKSTIAGISHMDTVEGTEKNKEQINSLISQAKTFLSENQVADIKLKDLDLESAKSEIVLDKALTVMEAAKDKGVITDDAFSSFESAAIKKVSIDRLALQNSANTGVATTGAINVATRSIKDATHDVMFNTDPTSVDMIRSILDIPEQEAISSKKIISAYDDKRGRDMTEILGDMFDPNKNRKSYAIDNENMTDLRNWFKTNAKDKIESIYDEFSPRLNSSVRMSVDSGKVDKFDAIMGEQGLFTNSLNQLADNELFQAKRMNYKSRNKAGVEIGNSTDTMSSVQGRMIGHADDNFYIRDAERKAILKEASLKQSNANDFYVNTQTTKQASTAVSNFVDGLSSSSIKLGGGLAMGALGLAGGLMAAGYASGNPLNDKQASQVADEQQMQQPTQTMSIPDFMDKQGGFVTGNSQQGYIINIKADTKKGKKHMQKVMKQAAEASVGGTVSVNMNIRNSSNGGITDSDIENFLERHF